jgi:L-fucose isomerase
MDETTIGLITLTLPTERMDLAEKWDKLAFAKLSDSGLAVLHHEKLVTTTEDAINASKNLESNGAQCLVYLLGTWIHATQILQAVKQVSLPFIIWSIPDPATFSLTGGGVTHGSLDEIGIEHRFVYGSPNSPAVIREIISYARAAMVVHVLMGAKMGNIGGITMGMYTSMVDYGQVIDIFGVEIEHMDQYQWVLEAEKVPKKDVDATYTWLRQEFGKIFAPEEIVRKSIRLYLGLKTLVKDRNYKLISIKGQPEIIDNYTSACLAVALINDDEIPCACEGDLNAALTMYILSLLANQPALFADVNFIDTEKNMLRAVNCGAMATMLAKSRKNVEWGHQYEVMGKGRGMTTIFCCRPGEVTLARLSRVKGRYVMLITTGIAFEQPKEVFKEAVDIWPHAFIKLDGDSKRFLENCRSNHIHMVYGNFKGDLIAICKILGIEPIII